jgi:RNA polymerase sigma-70 factor (ECF subfamily)
VNRQEVELLHATLGPLLYAEALSLIRDDAAARDIAQDVFLSLIANPNLEIQDPVAYAYTAMRNGVLRWREREARERKKCLFEEPIWVAPKDLAEEAAALEAALPKLTFEQREVIHMVYTQKMKRPAIAARLGLPLSTVESRLQHGIEKLESLFPTRVKE